MLQSLLLRAAFTAALLAAPLGAQLTITNGDAEDGPGGDGSTVVVTPGWTQTGDFTATWWNNPGWMTGSDPGPPDRGLNYFSGGQTAISTGAQTLDVSVMTREIDLGQLTYELNGWLGGWLDQLDHAVVSMDFLDAAGASLGTDQIGPVTPADRNNLTGLLERNTSGTLPAGTRSIDVLITLTRAPGAPATYYNDGYVDNVELTLVPAGGAKLSVTQMVAGASSVFVVESASPNHFVRLAYSTAGGGPIPHPSFGTVLLSTPITVLADVPTDANGDGSLTVPVPAQAAGVSVWLQALDLGTSVLSNGLAETIL